MPRFTFTPLREDDLDLARRWLLEPHVRRWWNDDPRERDYPRMAFDKYELDYAIIGPARSNVAAIRSYEKIGFRYLKEYREEDTTDPDHVLLDLRRSDLV